MPRACEAPLALVCTHGGAVYMDAPPAYCPRASTPADEGHSLRDVRRVAGDVAVRAAIVAAVEAHPGAGPEALAAVLSCARSWLLREARVVGVALPTGRVGRPRRGTPDAR